MQVYSATTTVFVPFFEQESIHRLTHLKHHSCPGVLAVVGPLTSTLKRGSGPAEHHRQVGLSPPVQCQAEKPSAVPPD